MPADWPNLTVLDPEEAPDAPPTVLITGATGNIGGKLRAAWADRYELILIDRDSRDDPEIVAADLSVYSEDWADFLDEVDAVVHLAASPDEFLDWPDLVAPNIDALCHVFHAAAVSGVGRLVFASSNHAMGGYRDRHETPITEHLRPRPGNPYGALKLAGERIGASLAASFGVEVVALRLGWIQGGENHPSSLPDDWARKLWLSNRDLVHLFERAIEADLPEPFVVVNGLSRNSGTRWDLSAAERILGYQPRDDAFAF